MAFWLGSGSCHGPRAVPSSSISSSTSMPVCFSRAWCELLDTAARHRGSCVSGQREVRGMGPGVRGQGDFLPALPSKAAEPAFSCELTCECFALPRRCPRPVYDENLRVSYSKTCLSLLLLVFFCCFRSSLRLCSSAWRAGKLL